MSIVLFLGSIPSVHKIFSEEKIVDVAEVNHGRFLKESGQRLENVDPTHRELTSANNKKSTTKKKNLALANHASIEKTDLEE